MTARKPPSRQRSRRRAAVLLAVVSGLALAGCGDRFGPGSEGPKDPSTAQAAAELPPLAPPTNPPTSPVASTPPASTPEPTSPAATTPAAELLGADTNVGGVIWQPRAVYEGQVQVSVRDGYLAAVVPSGDVAELRVSSTGEPPETAVGAGAIPSWGRPHVGTDVSGRTVVTYPRCEDPEAVGTCDIYAWTAATKRELVLRGVSGTALAETEAVMDFGAVLVVREKRPALSADDLRFDTPPLTTLILKPRGRPVRVVTRHGGREIDLRGSRIADVFVAERPTATDCGTRAARALNLDGLTIASREVPCSAGSGGATPTGPSVADNHLRFAITKRAQPGVAVDHDLATGRTRQAKLTQPIEWWTADGERSGYALDTVGDGDTASICAPAQADAAAAAGGCRVSRSAKLVWKPAGGDWKVAGGDTPVQD